MKNLGTFNRFKLNKNDAKLIKAGVTREEYCYTLSMIMSCNEITIDMTAAWGSNCGPVNSERLWHGECS